MNSFVSVVIPAHNEELYLPKTLEALAQQTYRHFETIVVANGCTDKTQGVAKGKCHKLLSMPQRGLSRARNIGAMRANGDLIVFLDADTLLNKEALGTIAREFSRAEAIGTLRGVPDTNKMKYRLIYFLKNTIHRTHLHYGSSGVIICWRDQFKAVGGFDEELHLRENSDLMQKLKRFGKYKYFSECTATTSMRRFEKRGAEMLFLWLKVWCISLFRDIRHRHYEPVR